MMKSIVSLCLTVCLQMVCMNSQASDDAYLKILEGEAESLELDQSGQLNNGEDIATAVRKKKQTRSKKMFGWSGMLEGDDLPTGLAPEQFESVLEDNFYGTYIFYTMLNSSDKKTIYHWYKTSQSPSLENVRKNILQLRKR